MMMENVGVQSNKFLSLSHLTGGGEFSCSLSHTGSVRMYQNVLQASFGMPRLLGNLAAGCQKKVAQ